LLHREMAAQPRPGVIADEILGVQLVDRAHECGLGSARVRAVPPRPAPGPPPPPGPFLPPPGPGPVPVAAM
ncbi:hypothetical protein, partial [Nocardia cyriacigeorgica]|uniref:hypothetical protein n=1 Tax=Nocardia cyriacigeorgica TaxID=135487 RepID=UPI002456BB0B